MLNQAAGYAPLIAVQVEYSLLERSVEHEIVPMAQTFGIDPKDPDTNAVIHGGKVHLKSDAALTVLSNLSGWGWTRILFAVPKPLRDPVYSLVARNRYRIFGKYDVCFVPDAELRRRVLE